MSEDEIRHRRQLQEWERHERQFAGFFLSNVKAVKNRKGLTAAQLAGQLSKVGWPLSVSSLNGMLGKKGRATITITEVFAFAAALQVPPVELLFPYPSWSGDKNPGVAIRPGLVTSPGAALDWFTGDSTHDKQDRLIRAAILEAKEGLRATEEALKRVTAEAMERTARKRDDDG